MDLENSAALQHEPGEHGDFMFAGPSQAMLDEIHDHLVYVLKEKLGWLDASNPEMNMGAGHVLIRFERAGQRYVFRVAKHGLEQHKRTMLAYRLVGALDLVPEKIYHDGICLVERHVDGVPMTAGVSDAVLVHLATQLGWMHALPAQGFGPLDYDTQGIFADAAAYYLDRPTVDVDWSEADLTDEQHAELSFVIEDANAIPPALLNAPVHIGHGDLWRNNILVTSTQSKILDWERIGAYPIERDLSFILAPGLSSRQRALFFSNYPMALAVNADVLRWFAKRGAIRDRDLRLDKKLVALRAIDSLTEAAVLGVE